MTISDVIQPGNRIDIKQMRALQEEEEGGDKAKVYQSKVLDIRSDTEIMIVMPIFEGRMVLFQTGILCDFVFYTKKGLYRGKAVVRGHYREGGTYMLLVSLKSLPQKFQRREYFRIDYLTEMQYYSIAGEVAALETTPLLLAEIKKPEAGYVPKKGMLQDISGGGVRFVSEEQYECGSFLLLSIHLSSDWMDETFHLVCQIVDSSGHSSLHGKFSNRAKFIFKDLRDREKIVRFVFEAERRMRKKEIG